MLPWHLGPVPREWAGPELKSTGAGGGERRVLGVNLSLSSVPGHRQEERNKSIACSFQGHCRAIPYSTEHMEAIFPGDELDAQRGSVTWSRTKSQ